MRLSAASRHDSLKASCVGAIGLGLGRTAGAVDANGFPAIAATLGEHITYSNSEGSVLSDTWADDDSLYNVSDDTEGFNKACNSKLAVKRTNGVIPHDHEGVTVNPMLEYGHAKETIPIDGGTWKGSGLTCVDGVLGLSVCRNIGSCQPAYMHDPPGSNSLVPVCLGRKHHCPASAENGEFSR